MSLITINDNLVDSVWGSSKPSMPLNQVSILDEKFTGLTVLEKYQIVGKKLENKVDALLITTLDDIDWILNLRGNDIPYNPVFFAYALFIPPQSESDSGSVKLFIKSEKVSDSAIQKHLKDNKVEVFDYDLITSYLS